MARKKKRINNSTIPDYEVEKIARCLLPDIIAFYESEEGQREFAEWKAKHGLPTKTSQRDGKETKCI